MFFRLVLIVTILSSIIAGYAFTATPQEKQDKKRDFVVVLPAKVKSVYDGDTITVEFTIKSNIRLLDCWAPEVKTKDPAEKKRGLESKKHLESLLQPGDNVVLEIPYDGTIGDSVSMSRFLAKVYKDVDGDGKDDNVSAIMVRDGYAKDKK